MPAKYDQETRAKAIRLFRDHAGDYQSPWAAMCAIAGRPGVSAETLRKWAGLAEVDAGQAPGTSSEAAQEIRDLKRRNRELEATIGVLKAATRFFARENDPQCR
jgi:transposase